jgi:hypothetical protein
MYRQEKSYGSQFFLSKLYKLVHQQIDYHETKQISQSKTIISFDLVDLKGYNFVFHENK